LRLRKSVHFHAYGKDSVVGAQFPDRGSLTLFRFFFIRLPVTVKFSEQFQAKLLSSIKISWRSKKSAKKRDQGIELNGSVKIGIVDVFKKGTRLR